MYYLVTSAMIVHSVTLYVSEYADIHLCGYAEGNGLDSIAFNFKLGICMHLPNLNGNKT